MKSFLAVLYRIEALVAAVAYAVVATLLIGEIVAREVFYTSIEGSLQIAVFGAVFAGFLGMSLATARNSHLRPQLADGWVPKSWDAGMSRMADVLSAAIFIVVGIFAILYVRETMITGERAAVLYWYVWPIQLVIPYAFLSSALRHIAFAIWPDLKPENIGMEG